MSIHITNLYNLGGTATLAQAGVLTVARSLGFKEIGLQMRMFCEDYWNSISHHIDGEIAKLYYGDIVIFQYPSWNGPDYDRVFVDKVKSYSGTRLIIFVHDMQKLMFNSEQHILECEIEILNKADLLILPSLKMHNYLLGNGLDGNLPVVYQKIWEMPGFPCFTQHENQRKFIFTGNYERFPFLSEYNGKTLLEQYDGHEPQRKNDSHFEWKGFYEPVKLMQQIAKGGFGLVWCDDEYLQRYYSLNQPHKLGFNLASGIPVIIKNGCVHSSFIRDNGLGFVADTIEEADDLVQKTSAEEYRNMVSNVAKYQYLLLKGFYTRKLLIDSVIKVMEL